MTSDKKLKRVVRERMTRTGERYAAARRQVIQAGPPTSTPGDPGGPPSSPRDPGNDRSIGQRPATPIDERVLSGYRHLGGHVQQLSTLANALEASGAIAPHSGRPYSEAMLLGLGGGIGGGYFMFQFKGTPTMAVIGARHLWQDDIGFLTGVMTRLGVAPEVFESAGRRAGDSALGAAMAGGRPVLAWTDMASLPYLFLPASLKKYLLGVVGICGVDDERNVVLVDDRAAIPWELDRADFAVARGLIATSRHRLMHVDPPPADLDLSTAVLDALRYGHRQRTQPPIRNFGLPALAKWAALVADTKDPKGWPRTLALGPDLRFVLQWAFRSIEIGTGGGGYRKLFADFLEEAAVVTGLDALREVGQDYYRLAGQWSELAYALLPDDVAPLLELREIELGREALLLWGGAEALQQLEALSRKKAAVEGQMAAEFPMTDADRLSRFAGLRDRIVAIHEGEVAATTALQAIVGD